MADNIIGISFGVAGGSSLSGESGARIKKQLMEIAQEISKEPLPVSFQPVKIDIDKSYFTSQLDALRQEIDAKLGHLKITVDTTGVDGDGTTNKPGSTSSGDSDSDGAKKQAQEFAKLKTQLEELYASYTKLDKEFNSSSKKYQALKGQADTLKTEYDNALALAKSGSSISPDQITELENLRVKLEQTRSAQQALNEATQQDKMANGMQTSFKGLVANVEALNERYGDLIKHNKEAAAAMEKLRALANADYRGVDGWTDENGVAHSADYTEATNQIKELAQASKTTSAQFSKLEAQSNTLGKKLRETFTNKIIQTFAYALIGLATRALRQVYNNVIELDKAITDLQIATGKTREETAQLVVEYAKLAKQLGATVTEVTSAADTWLRQGYSVAETNQLIADTLMLSKLGQLESAEAAKALTSAMKGYKVEVEDAIKIVDKFTAVDMEAAASAGDIATAMAETATSADIAGVSMDKLIGYIATVKEVTQDGAESVGTFYKTLFARMGNVKAGKFVDEETGESLNDVETVLSGVGISLRNSNGLFKDFGDVLDEVASKWEEYNNVQQHAIATAFAGTRQQEKFIVLMENYGTAMEYANTAAMSGGTAQDKYDSAYLDSIEAKINTLTASWQSFSQNVLDSEVVKFFADLLSGIVNVLDAIISFGDGFVLKIVAIGAAIAISMALINKAFGGSILTLKDFKAAVQLSAEAIGKSLKKLAQNPYVYITLMIALFTTLSKELGTAGKFIAMALAFISAAVLICLMTIDSAVKTFMKSNIFGWILAAITAVVSGIIALIDAIKSLQPPSYEELKEELGELKEAYKELKDEVEEINDALEENYERIEELIQLKNRGDISTEQENELAILKQQTAQLERQKQLLEEQLELKGKDVYNKAKEAYDKFISDDGGNFDFYLGEYEFGGQSGKEYVNNYISEISGLIEGMEYYADAVEGSWQESQNKFIETVWESQDKFSVACGNFASVWDALIYRLKFSGAVDALKRFANGVDVSVDALTRLYNTNDEVKQFIDYLVRIGAVSLDDTESLQALIQQILGFKDDTSDTTKELQEELTILQKLIKLVEEFEGSHNILKQAQKDMEELGVISADTLKEISESYPELLKYLQKTEDGYKLVTNASNQWYEDSKIQKNTDLQNKVNEFQNSLSAGISGLKEKASNQIHLLQVDLAVGDIDQETYNKKYNEIISALAQDIAALEADAQAKINEAIQNSDEEFELTEVAFNVIEREELIDEYVKKLEEESDALDDRLDKYKDLIDVRKDLLESYASELEYQKELAQKQKSVADLETKLAIARLDKSAAGQARVRELEGELKSAKEDLDDYTLDKAIDDICAELDASNDEYKAFIEKEVNIIKTAIENAATLSTSQLRAETGKPEHTVSAPNVGNTNVEKTDTNKVISDVNSSASSATAEVDDGKLGRFEKVGFHTDNTGINIGHIYYSEEDFNNRTYHAKDGSKYFDWYGFGTGISFVSFDDIDFWRDGSGYRVDIHTFKPMYKKYHTGGFVGGMAGLQSNEEFAKLLTGEFVATPAQMDRFMKETLPQMANRGSDGSINYNAPLISLECETVTKDALPELKQIVDEAVKKVKSEIDSGLSRNGYKRPVNKFST